MASSSDTAKKKILVPLLYRAHLGRLRPVLRAIQNHPRLTLQVAVGTQAAYGSFFTNLRHAEPRSWRAGLPWYVRSRVSALLPHFSLSRDSLSRKVAEAGFPIDASVPLFVEGGTPRTMAKSMGLGVIRFTDACLRLKPDMMLIHADRFEMMAIALAAVCLNIPIAHNEAGDVSGTIDESIRHAITKFAHMHFAATEESRRRVVQMGEDPGFAFTVGSPAIDALMEMDLRPQELIFKEIDPLRPYLLIVVHPVTTESREQNETLLKSVLDAAAGLRMQAVFVGWNPDAHSRAFDPIVTAWMREVKPAGFHRIKWAHPDRYLRALAGAACVVGNSSSFIREAAYLGVPSVLVGSRQQGRERGENAIEVAPDGAAIERAVRQQIAHGAYPRDLRFGDGHAGEKIAEILARENPPIQKRFYDLKSGVTS